MKLSLSFLLLASSPLQTSSLWNPFSAESPAVDPSQAARANGLSLAMDGMLAEALPFFEQAVRGKPTDLGFINDLAVTHMNMGNLDEAKEWFDKAMVLDLTNDDINKNSIALKAHLDHRARKQEEAARQEDFEGRVEEVKRMANKPVEPVVETVEPYRLGSYRNPNGPPPSRREAVREAKKAERQAAADPEQRQGLPTRAKGSKKQGTVPKGTKPKKSAAPEDDHWGSSSVPDYEPEPVKQQKGGEFETPQEYMQAAYALANADDLKGALPYFKAAVALAPTQVSLMNDLGVTYMRLNMLPECQEMFDAGLKIAPDYQPIHDNYVALQQHLDHRANVEREREDEAKHEEFMSGMAEINAQGNEIHIDPKYKVAGAYGDDDDEEEEEVIKPVVEERRGLPTRPKGSKEKEIEEKREQMSA